MDLLTIYDETYEEAGAHICSTRGVASTCHLQSRHVNGSIIWVLPMREEHCGRGIDDEA